MAIKMHQSMQQTQSLVMTPQLQQAIKLLTLTHMEMTDVIAKEMVDNPMLEEKGGEMSSADVDGKSRIEKENAAEAKSENFDGPDVIKGAKDEIDWNKYIDSYNSHSASPPSMVGKGSVDDQPNYENMVSRSMSLAEHLMWQLRMEHLTKREQRIATEIIYNIEDDGYLENTFKLEEFSKENNFPLKTVENVLDRVKKLDPLGCGSRDLAECLMAQARALIPRMDIVERIILEFLDLYQTKNHEKLSEDMGVSLESIKIADMVLSSFNPKPGRLVSPEAVQYVVPDIYVYELAGKFVTSINDEGVPSLRVSNLYRAMLKNKNTPDKEQEYIQDKLRQASWLIKSIETRQKTIQKVADAIVKYQPEFFKKGAIALRPMILKDIAAEIGMHESTVSRVTTNKYMHTPIGVFELKYFFNAGIGGKSGGIDIAMEPLKLKIKELVENEEPTRPLSDQKISQLLALQDIKVARRTVAKYREILNILPSSKRKRKK